MKKYCTSALSIILLAFILIFCYASAETAAEIPVSVTTESPAVVTTDITVISAPAAEPSKVAETTPPETDNTPFDLTPYYIKPEPVSDAYRFTIITRYYDGASDNNFVLPRLTSDKNGAASLNKKIKDNFLSKRNALLNQLSHTGSVQTITASSDYSYTVNGGIIVISLETDVGIYNSEYMRAYAVYYYNTDTDRELTFEEYLITIGESVQSILDIINEDGVRLTYSGYYYNDDFYFTAANLLCAYKRDDGAFCVIMKNGNEEFKITTPYTTENNYCVYTLSGNSAKKYSSILFKQTDDYSNGWHANYELACYRDYELLWIDSDTVAVTYYTKPNLRSFAVINLYNKSPGYYKCNISAEDVLTANNIDPVIFGTKPGLDIYPESMNNESKILTVKYKFIGYNLTGELYYNTETNEVYFPHNEEKPVYIADASRLIDNVGNSILFTFPHKGITLTMTLPDEIITSKYNASGNYETILTRNIGWDMSINCYRNYTSAEITPEEGCKTFFTSSESYPGQWEMVSENVFVSDIIHISNGKEYSFEDEFVIAYYLSGKDDIFITLNYRGLYTHDQIKEIAKSISWNKITK